ncbi:CST complex subunit CTC1-like [Oratosquilla oratoria]|uniref:CST complex subunit CTC1-like n=1 Tax=Oratosquilla oratoria TaxID=337810 RepID=UPI003F77376F
MELTGKLVALGHVFELRPHALFVADFYDGNQVCHVFVRRPSQLAWHSTLAIGHDYTITNLKEDIIYKGSLNITILHTSRSSQLHSVCQEEKYSNLSFPRKGFEDLICYQGKITAVIDEDLGLYQLDHREYLVLSHLLGLVADFPVPDVPPLHSATPHDPLHKISSEHEPPMRLPSSCVDVCHVNQKENGQPMAVPHCSRKTICVGDSVRIYFAHRSQYEDKRFLVCCGRSLMRWERKTNQEEEEGIDPGKHTKEMVLSGSSGGKRSVYAALDTVLLHNLGFKAVWWIYELQCSLMEKLCPDLISEELIRRRHVNKVPGVLMKLLSVNWDQSVNGRSLLLEFLEEPHKCVFMQDFYELFCVPSLHDLTTEVKEQLLRIRNHSCKVWLHSTVDHFPQVGQEKTVLCGLLTKNADGLIGIADKSYFLRICMAGDCDMDLDKVLGAVVAISGFQIVCEKFNLLMEHAEKNIFMVYTMFEAANMYNLWKGSVKERSASSPVIPSFLFRVLAKSGMVYQENPHQVNLNSFFMVLAAIEETGTNRRRTTYGSSTKMFLRFLGQGAQYHKFVKEGSVYRVFLPPGSPNVLLKSRTVPWLHFLKEHFGTCDMVDLPEETLLEKAYVEKPLSVVISVSEVLQKEVSSFSGLVHVCGVVVERQLMTPKHMNEIHRSNRNKRPFPDGNDESRTTNLDINNFIGIPGSKILRVLLKDKKETNDTIWAYFSFNTPSHTFQYTLGIIPEAIVILENFSVQMSKQSSRLYLQNTLFSQVQLAGLPSVKMAVDSAQSHQYLYDVLCKQESKSTWPAPSIFTFVTISRIFSVSIKMKCSSCQSEYHSGGCGFVGCHAAEKPEIDSSAKVVVDDGTHTAILFFKNDLVRKLLMLSENQWIMLADMLNTYSRKLTFHGVHCDSNRQNTVEEKYFALMCSSPQLLRSVAVKCRPFKSKDQMNKQEIQMFVLEISNLTTSHKIQLKN